MKRNDLDSKYSVPLFNKIEHKTPLNFIPEWGHHPHFIKRKTVKVSYS